MNLIDTDESVFLTDGDGASLRFNFDYSDVIVENAIKDAFRNYRVSNFMYLDEVKVDYNI